MEIGGSRTAQQCAGRYNGHLSLKHKKGIWAVEENETLVSLVNHMGLSSWTDIAKRLPGRTPKQCNAKWYRSLNPEIVRNQWSNEENLILKQAHAQFGECRVISSH
jgi:myb proto-oncogene protein